LKFINNTAYGGIAESIYSKNFADSVNLDDVKIESEKNNAIYMEDGHDIKYHNVTI
jgi:hypothetical protein